MDIKKFFNSLGLHFGLGLSDRGPVSSFLLGINLIDALILALLFGSSNLFSPQSAVLIKMGALFPPFFFMGEYWRLITYGYLHIGILHIVMNMIALSQVGPELEDEIGSARFFVVYTLSLLGGGIADLVIRGDAPIVVAGASGALFGLIGFGISYSHFYGGRLGKAHRDFFFKWALYAFIFGFLVRADNIAHFGGLIVGAFMGMTLSFEKKYRNQLTPLWALFSILCLLITLASFAWMIWARGTYFRE